MKRIISKLNVILILLLIGILIWKLLAIQQNYADCIQSSTIVNDTGRESNTYDSLFYSFVNKKLPEDYRLKGSTGHYFVSHLDKTCLYLYLSDTNCDVCLENKFRLILNDFNGIRPDQLMVLIPEISERDLYLFATNNYLNINNIYMIQNCDSVFPLDHMESFLFTISSDNRIQNLKSFEYMIEEDMRLYISLIRLNLD